MTLKNKSDKISVIGAGSWGTALACSLSGKGYKISLWGHRKETIENLLSKKENTKYLPGIALNPNIVPTYELEKALRGCTTVCMVVPSHGFRKVFESVVPFLEPETHIVSAVKGIEKGSLMTMSQVMVHCLKEKMISFNISLSVLSGPSFAREVAECLPTAITVGNVEIEKARVLQNVFSSEKLRVYTSTDLIGIEVCAAFKNIVAIAAGISDGLNFGLNARAAIITRGLAEIRRLGLKMGAQKDTFSGLSGIGDLILTCTGDLSRNRSVGIKLGEGKKLVNILEEMSMVAEGVKTTESGSMLAQKYHVEMPILEQVYEILYKGKDCKKAVQDLLSRELRDE